jgi:ketosteroid isomerase-like protein
VADLFSLDPCSAPFSYFAFVYSALRSTLFHPRRQIYHKHPATSGHSGTVSAHIGNVEHNDLAAYSDLWHENFLGWPSVSSAPVRKNHITDWITSQTAKGLALKTVEFKPGAIQVTGDVAFACYWVTFRWVDKEDSGAPHTFRITHAWVRSGKDWHIIGGMSMPEPENRAK